MNKLCCKKITRYFIFEHFEWQKSRNEHEKNIIEEVLLSESMKKKKNVVSGYLSQFDRILTHFQFQAVDITRGECDGLFKKNLHSKYSYFIRLNT